MSRTYIAIDTRNDEVAAAFNNLTDFNLWLTDVDKDEDDVYRVFWLSLYRIESHPSDTRSVVTEMTREEVGFRQ